MHKWAVIILILLFGCGQQLSNDENSSESLPETSKADTIHSMPDHVDSFSEDGIEISESDTVIISGHRLIFQLTDSVEMTDIFDDSPLRKQMTDSIGNAHQRYILIEKYLAKKFSSYFTADDNTLIVFLEGKSQMKFPKWDDEKDEGYNFEHHFSSIGYYLLRVQWGEGNDWMLVNRINGFKKRIIGEPYISPDAKSILSVNSTMPGYGYVSFP